MGKNKVKSCLRRLNQLSPRFLLEITVEKTFSAGWVACATLNIMELSLPCLSVYIVGCRDQYRHFLKRRMTAAQKISRLYQPQMSADQKELKTDCVHCCNLQCNKLLSSQLPQKAHKYHPVCYTAFLNQVSGIKLVDLVSE